MTNMAKEKKVEKRMIFLGTMVGLAMGLALFIAAILI